MEQKELNNYVKQLGIAKDQILREEAEMELLDFLAQDKISAKVVFYGGTALRLAYNSPRFSEDLDLLSLGKTLTFSEFRNLALNVSGAMANWKLTDIKDKRNTYFALFSIKDEKLKHNFSIKIEIHKPVKKIKLESELRLITSPVSSHEPLFLVPKVSELKKLKEDALIGRKKARDIFDLWYIAQLSRENFILPQKLPQFSQKEFENELKVFLPKKYYPVTKQLYEQINRKN